MAGVVLGGLRIGFSRAGQGPPVVLLGGFVGSGDTTWRHQIEALSRSHTVLVWDAPGLGGSPDVPTSFQLPDYADRLAELLSWSELEPAVLVGLSFGGAVALE